MLVALATVSVAILSPGSWFTPVNLNLNALAMARKFSTGSSPAKVGISNL